MKLYNSLSAGVPEMTREQQVLVWDRLLWLRNHYYGGKAELRVDVLKDVDEVLDMIRGQASPVQWAVERWKMEVRHRPLDNRNRRPLDDAWRQVIRHFGGDDVALCGPTHDDLVEASRG